MMPPSYKLSIHATMRAQQRGIQRDAIEVVICYADVILYAGAGCQSLCLSRRAVVSLLRDGVPASLIDRAAHVILMVVEDTEEIVTVMHDRGDRARRYRRQWDARKKRLRHGGRGSPRLYRRFSLEN